MIMEDILIVGFGGHAKSVADCTDDELQSIFNGGVKHAAIGIGYLGKGEVRWQIYGKLKDVGFSLPVIADPSAIISTTAVLGEGTFVGKGAIVNAETIIGKMVIINTKALVEHECVVGDYSHVAVGAVLCGQVKVGEGAFIGANATVIQCREVKSNTIIPAGETIR